MKNELLGSIGRMIVNGNRLELPKDEQFSNYAAVKKCLLAAGGKYKKCGFEFSNNAKEVKSRLLGGEVINDKKKFQYYMASYDLDMFKKFIFESDFLNVFDIDDETQRKIKEDEIELIQFGVKYITFIMMLEESLKLKQDANKYRKNK